MAPSLAGLPSGLSTAADIEIIVEEDGSWSPKQKADADNPVEVSDDGAVIIHLPDGSVIIDSDPDRDGDDDEVGGRRYSFNENLAEKLDDAYLMTLASDLLLKIDEDDRSRQQWLQARAAGIELLGLKIEDPRGDIGSSSAPLEGMSTVRDPVLAEAVIRFQANGIGELLPAAGPVKVRNDGDDSAPLDDLGEALERDFNHFLTVTATEYYPDTRRMLFWVGFGGCSFKKTYHSPLRERPVSESVDAEHLIVNNSATDLETAARVTHVIPNMRKSDLIRMQILGVYRKVELGTPLQTPNPVDAKKAAISGIDITSKLPEDQDYTIYECYCELDIPGNEHRDRGAMTGLPLPYRVTIDKTSQQVLEISRNWDEDDDAFRPRKVFTKFSYVDAMGFYGIGLLHIVGNFAKALTATDREMIDAGMFASFPGFIFAQGSGRQLQNNFRVAPGGGVGMQVPLNMRLQDALMPLPYKPLDQAFVAFMENLRQVATRLGGTAEMQIGEGAQNAPVGTTMAMIEQATKVEGAVFKGLHQAQSQELQALRKLFEEDPEALWRHNEKAKTFWSVNKFLAALQSYRLTPVSDPNNPTHMQRMGKATAAIQMAVTAPPGLFDLRKTYGYALHMMGINPDDLLAAPMPAAGPQPDPIKLGELQLKQQGQQLDWAKTMADLTEAAKDRKSKEDLELLKLAQTLVVHPQSQQIAQAFLNQVQADQHQTQAPVAPPAMPPPTSVPSIPMGGAPGG